MDDPLAQVHRLPKKWNTAYQSKYLLSLREKHHQWGKKSTVHIGLNLLLTRRILIFCIFIINCLNFISRECHICKEIFQKEEDLWKHHTANHSGLSLTAGNVFKDRPPVRRVPSDQKPWIPQKVAGNFKFKMDKLQSPSVSSTQVDNSQVMSDSSDSSPVPKV